MGRNSTERGIMFNDNIIRRPVNGTAARVVGQKGCVDELTPEQERDSIIDHLKVVDIEMLSLPKKDKHRKVLGIKRFKLCTRLSELKKQMKIFGFGTDNRIDQLDYVINSMTKHLTTMQYRRIMDDAFALSQEDKDAVAK